MLPKQVRYQTAPRPDTRNYRIENCNPDLRIRLPIVLHQTRCSVSFLEKLENLDRLNFDYSQNAKKTDALG